MRSRPRRLASASAAATGPRSTPSRTAQRQRHDLGMNAVAVAQQHLRQGRAGARALVKGDATDGLPGHAAEESDAEDGTARGDRDVRHDGVRTAAEVFDDWDEGDIELSGGELGGE